MTLRLAPKDIVAQSTSPHLTIADWWERCRLGDIAEVTNGAAFKSALFNADGIGMPLIRIRDVGQPTVSTHFNGAYEDRHVVDSGDLLIGMDGDFRIARWTGQQALLNQRVCRLRVRNPDLYCDRFLEYVLEPYLDEIHKVTSSVTVKHLSSRTVADLPIPLPPWPEQKRIVAAIQEHFSRLDAASDAIAAARARIEALRRSVLSEAFAGRLVPPDPSDEPASVLLERIAADRRTESDAQGTQADPSRMTGDLPYGWIWATVADVSDVQLGRQRSPQHHAGEQMRPYLRAANVTWQGVRLDDVKEMNFNDVDFEKFGLASGDILLNEASGSPHEVGKPAIWDNQIEGCCFQNTLLRLRPRLLNRNYLYWYCYASALAGRFGEAGRGVNIRHLGKQGLAQFPISIAPLAEQERIVTAIEEHFSRLDAASDAIAAARARIEALRRSVLSEAFAGRLAPQDPRDEPASVLLERIAASRTAKPNRRVSARRVS